MAAEIPRKVIFISYARKDGAEHCIWLHDQLSRAGFDPWFDQRDIDPYQDFTAEIENAIERADYVVACLTPDVRRDNSFVRREIQYALLIQEDTGGKPRIIPLVFPGGRPLISISTLTFIPFMNDTKQLDRARGLQQLFQRLGVNDTTTSGFTQEKVDLPDVAGAPGAPEVSDIAESSEIVDTPVGQSEADDSLIAEAEVEEEAVVWDIAAPVLPLVDEAPLPPVEADFYRPYLREAYRQVKDHLGQTIFSLLTLRSTATPNAVEQTRALPMTFSDVDDSREFVNFPDAFEHFGGSLLLLGEPGAGKTTTLMAYAREIINRRLEDPSLPLPVILRIAEWPRDKRPPLVKWIADSTSLEQDNIQEMLSAGQLLLLLDGLDELGEKYEVVEEGGLSERKRVRETFDPRLRFLEMLESSVGKNRILLTSRIKDYEDIGKKINLKGAITLRALDDDQMAEYLAHQPDLLTAVQADEALRDMARTPLLLSLLTFAYSGMEESERIQLRDLSHSPSELRGKIFDSYIQRRFEHEARRPDAHLPYSIEDIYNILSAVAAIDIANGKVRLTDFRYRNASLQQDKRDLFLHQMRRLHILIGDNENPRFIHLLLRDHFALIYCMKRLVGKPFGYLDWTSVKAVGKLGETRVITPLIEWMNTWLIQRQTTKFEWFDQYDVPDVITALGSSGNAVATPVLRKLLEDRSGSVHRLERRVRIRRLIPDAEERIAALKVGGIMLAVGLVAQNIIALVRAETLSPVPTWLVVLVVILSAVGRLLWWFYENREWYFEYISIRNKIITSLDQIGDMTALLGIISALNDSDKITRQAAFKVLQSRLQRGSSVAKMVDLVSPEERELIDLLITLKDDPGRRDYAYNLLRLSNLQAAHDALKERWK